MRRAVAYPAFALYLAYLIVACLAVRVAYAADTTPIDVTTTLVDVANVVIPLACMFIVYFVRSWAKSHSAGQSEQLDWNAIAQGLAAAANTAVNRHLLAGKPVTIDTHSELGNEVVSWVKANLPAELQRVRLSDQAIAAYADAAAAKVLNQTPSAPPFLPAPAAVAAPTVSP